MPLNRKVTLSIAGNIADIQAKIGWVKSGFEDVKKDAKDIPISGDAGSMSRTLASTIAKVADLSKAASNIKLGFDDKKGRAQLAQVNYQLDKLNNRTAEPRVSVSGVLKANAEALTLEATLERLGSKNVGGGFFSRLKGFGANTGGDGPLPLPGVLSNPYVLGGGLGVGAVAAPLLGQAAGGTLVAGFGAALAAIGILGASKTKQVQNSFSTLAKNANKDLLTIGKPFIPVLTSILGTATSVMGKMTPVFAGAEKIISGPFKQFANTLLTSFNQPAVITSINAVARAFGSILKNLAPSLPGLIREVANAITSIANTIAKNPGAFGAFITFLTRLVVYSLSAVNALAIAANFIERNFHHAIVDIGVAFAAADIVVTRVIQAMVDGVLSGFGEILHGASMLVGWVPGFGSGVKRASAAFDSFKNHVDGNFSSLINQVQNFQNQLNGLHSKSITVSMRGDGQFTVVGTESVYSFKAGNNAYRVKASAAGGHITGPGSSVSDSIPAWLSNGEYVVRASAVSKYGVGMLNALNAGHFANGGLASLGASLGGWSSNFQSQMLGTMERSMSAARGYSSGGPVVGPALASAGGGGGVVWTGDVIVNASPLSHPADVGREVVNAIKEFEKGSGKSWRK